MDPVIAVTSWVRRRACTPSRALGAGRGGAGHGRCPVEMGGGGAQDPLGMQIRSQFNLNSPNSLQTSSQRKFAANSA